MADRPVTHSRKDTYGNIIGLGNPSTTWSVRASADVIRDIESGLHTYYVPWPEKRTAVRVVPALAGKYLRTDRDSTTRNNLDDLPNI